MRILLFFMITITIIVFAVCLFYARELYNHFRRTRSPATRNDIIAMLTIFLTFLGILISASVAIYQELPDNPVPPPEHDCSAKVIRFKVTWEDTGDSLVVDDNRVHLTRNSILMIEAHDGMNGGDNSQSALHCEWKVLEDEARPEENGCILKFKPRSDEHIDTIQVTASYPNCKDHYYKQTIFIHPPDDK